MKSFVDIFGFTNKANRQFRIGRQRFRIGPRGAQTLKHLVSIYELCQTTGDRNCLIRVRPLIRDTERLNSGATLSLVVSQAKDPALRILAIWLRGRCGGTLGTKIVSRFANDLDFKTRKEVARALRRMSGWQTLDEMAADDPIKRIRNMATCKPARPIVERIARFMNHVSRRSVPPAKKDVFVAANVDYRHGKPPKSAELIRVILQRIRRLLNGHA